MARQPRKQAPAVRSPGAKSRATGAAKASPRAKTVTLDVAAAGSLPHVLRRYGPVYGALAAGVLVGGVAFVALHELWIALGAVAFFVVYLAAILSRLPKLNPQYLRLHADQSDTPGYVILIVALATLVAACASLFVLLNSGEKTDPLHMTVGIAALVLGWLAIHSMLGFHYAYEFYGTDMGSPVGADGKRPHIGGLEFPGSELPDALSFLYFSFVVAMTAQVSDVTVTSNTMRRLVLAHGILAFFFNTVILAVAVNVVVSLGH